MHTLTLGLTQSDDASGMWRDGVTCHSITGMNTVVRQLLPDKFLVQAGVSWTLRVKLSQGAQSVVV